MTRHDPRSTEPVSGADKAAMFLMGIGEQVTAELLRQLDPEEIRRITSEIAGSGSRGAASAW